MRRDPGLISHAVNRLNSMQQPFARRPEFYFFNEPKQFNPFAIEALSRLFSWFFLCHDVKSPGNGLEAKSSEIRELFLPSSYAVFATKVSGSGFSPATGR